MDTVSFFWSFVKMLSALALVIALMIGAMVIIKKYFYQSPAVSNGSALINIVSTRHLGPKSSLILLEVLGQVLLVGHSNQELSLLTTITDPDALNKLNSFQLKKNTRSAPDPFSRYKLLFEKVRKVRKDR